MRQSKLDIDSYVNELAKTVLAPAQPESDSLELVLKGLAIELWSDAADRLFIVATEEDARRLSDPGKCTYAAAEMRRVVQIADARIVLEVHEWMRMFKEHVPQSGGMI